MHERILGQRLTKVDLTNLDKILFPKLKVTKGQVIELRMPRFRGLRNDKPPHECTLDQTV